MILIILFSYLNPVLLKSSFFLFIIKIVIPVGIKVYQQTMVKTMGFTAHVIKKKTIFIALDTTLLSVQGIAGILIFVLFFFSSHPTVDSNYLIWVLNPLPLFVLFPKIRNIRKKRVDYISVVYSIILLLFLVASPFIPQKFSCAIICFVVSLLLQALTVCFIQYKCKWKRS